MALCNRSGQGDEKCWQFFRDSFDPFIWKIMDLDCWKRWWQREKWKYSGGTYFQDYLSQPQLQEGVFQWAGTSVTWTYNLTKWTILLMRCSLHHLHTRKKPWFDETRYVQRTDLLLRSRNSYVHCWFFEFLVNISSTKVPLGRYIGYIPGSSKCCNT